MKSFSPYSLNRYDLDLLLADRWRASGRPSITVRWIWPAYPKGYYLFETRMGLN